MVPKVFEPLKFDCICKFMNKMIIVPSIFYDTCIAHANMPNVLLPHLQHFDLDKKNLRSFLVSENTIVF